MKQMNPSRYNLTKLTKDKQQNLNIFIFVKVTGFVMRNFFMNKYPGANEFYGPKYSSLEKKQQIFKNSLKQKG